MAAAIVGKWIYIGHYLKLDQATLPYGCLSAALAVILHVCFRGRGLYAADALRSGIIRASELCRGMVLAFLILLGLLYLAKSAELVSRGWVIVWAVLSLLTLLAIRLAWRWQMARLVADGRLCEPVALISSKELAAEARERLTTSFPHLRIVGVYTDGLDDDPPWEHNGGIEDLVEKLRSAKVNRIVIALPTRQKDRILNAINRVAVLGKDLQIYCHSEEWPVPILSSSRSGGVILHAVMTSPPVHRAKLAKAILDYGLASLGLIILAPILAIIALAISLDGKGSIIFRQRRYGENGRVFTIYKFRTMTVLEDGPVMRPVSKGDVRVTRVGRILRRTSLDELPQLFNVLRGDMSIVGPRPHAVAQVDHYAAEMERFTWRHQVKPGMTGWAQVNGLRGLAETSEEMLRRVEHDLYYIENWSVWFDIEIILRTFVAIIIGKGAH